MSVARIDLPPKRPQNTAIKDGNPHRKNHGAEASPPEITGIQWAGTLNRIVGPEESAVVFEIRVYGRGRREDSETGEGSGIPTQTQGANSPQSKVENIFTLMLGNKMYVNQSAGAAIFPRSKGVWLRPKQTKSTTMGNAVMMSNSR